MTRKGCTRQEVSRVAVRLARRHVQNKKLSGQFQTPDASVMRDVYSHSRQDERNIGM